MMTKGHFTDVLSVERAISDLRRGYGVVVAGEEQPLLAFAADTVADSLLSEAHQALKSPCSLILTQKRLDALGLAKGMAGKAGKLPLPLPLDKEMLYFFSGLDFSVPRPHQHSSAKPAGNLEEAALMLVKLAELIPAVLVIPIPSAASKWLASQPFLTVADSAIRDYQVQHTLQLQTICHAPLCLDGAEQASITVYRPTLGGGEHYAIIIGNPLQDAAPLVRIHSSCYTGDLLRSLKCDCGDQLHEAIRFMGQQAKEGKPGNSGGVILYLMQEGRGIGLTNKLRAYDLQATGMDTVDANETLGFDDDERLFLPAVRMLELLTIKTIRLLTNNPRKAKGLEEAGIHVEACVPHITQAHQHNDSYLKTKAERLGHVIPPSHFKTEGI